jgi:hypothetical protein
MAVAKLGRLRELVAARQQRELDSPELDRRLEGAVTAAMDKAMDEVMARLAQPPSPGKPSGPSPASSASTPAPGR